MARIKKRLRAAGEDSGGVSPTIQPTASEAVIICNGERTEYDTPTLDPHLAPPSGRFGIGAYLLFNVIFAAFCVAQLLLVRWQLGEQKGLFFFFALLMAAFFVVSVFDYLYDRFIDP